MRTRTVIFGWSFPLLAALCLLLVALPLAAQEGEEGGARTGNAHILGIVTDRESEAPIGTARVLLTTEQGEEVWSGVTDTQGRFRITLIPPGDYDVSFTRLAYKGTTERVTVPPESELDMRVRLTLEAIELEPVVVTSFRRSELQAVGFYDRRRTFAGDFLLPEELEDRNPIAVAHILRMNPAFHVIGDASVLGRRGGLAPIPGRPLCPPAVFLDGMPMEYDPVTGMRDDGLENPFNIVKPNHLAAMEIYSGTMTPAQFYTRGACGAIVMWTNRGDLAPGEPEPTRSGLRRFVMAMTTAAGFHLLLGN